MSLTDRPTTPHSTGSEAIGMDRRSFLTRTTLGVGGALVMGIELAPGSPLSGVAAASGTGGSIGVYVTIGADESVTLVCPGAEMGQGISTALPMILAEHLMIDWSKVSMVLAGAGNGYARPKKVTSGDHVGTWYPHTETGIWDPSANDKNGTTALGTASQSSGGSNSVRGYHDYLAHMGTKIRLQMLTAAQTYGGASYALSDLKVVDGVVQRTSDSGTVATYGELASAAALVTIADTDVATSMWVQPANYKIVGTRKQRFDIPAKVDGSAVFGLDVRLPGMKYAAVKLSPKIGQTVASVGTPPAGTTVVELFDDLGAKVGIAVVHPRSGWDAMRAVAATSVTWTDAAYTSQMDTALLKTKFATLLAADFATLPAGQGYADTTNNYGDAAASLASVGAGETLHNATYTAPYVNHVTMEPMNATVLVAADGSTCEVWAPSQTQVSATSPGARETAMGILGITADKVTMHTTYLGGGFGRRLKNDYVRYAVHVANHPSLRGTPVKVMWSRPEDFTHDFHRPAAAVRFDAKLGADNKIAALKAKVVGGRTSNAAVTKLSTSAVDGISTALYGFGNKLVQWVDDQAQVPVASWRSVGNSQNCFFIESFMDELAAARSIDPITFRINHLDGSTTNGARAIAVLNRLRTESGWDTAPAAGRQRGVALSMSFGDTVCAQVAEVSGTPTSGFKVWKVTVVIDPFSIVNPDTVEAQIQSAVIQGLGTAMYNSQTMSAGTIQKRNFDTYKMIRMIETPVEIRTIVIQSDQTKKGGIGEPGLPPIAPAVSNALARLNGTRFRDLPLTTSTVVNPPPPTSSKPTITTIEPTKGPVGTVVTVKGTNLGTVTLVKLGTATCTIKEKAASQLTFWVPAGAASAKVTVTNPAGSATSSTTFTVTKR
ncbi:MAG: molybdopterin cofactor-binding domain-containing protein [Ilumatobacteraceae bacterium]